jgi:uncharacterized membrane protein
VQAQAVRGRRGLILAAAFCATAPAACGQTSHQTPDAGGADPADVGATVCMVVPPTVCPDPPPHFPDIHPIVQQRCAPCHNGVDPDGPWPLLEYHHVADWQDVVRDNLRTCAMPPADGGIAMADEERNAILTWLLCGYLE